MFLLKRAEANFKLKSYRDTIEDCTNVLNSKWTGHALKLRTDTYLILKQFKKAIKDYVLVLQAGEEQTVRDCLNNAYNQFESNNRVEYHHFILGVDRTSTFKEIQKKYKDLFKINHPDKADKDKLSQEISTQFCHRLSKSMTYFRNIEERKKLKK